MKKIIICVVGIFASSWLHADGNCTQSASNDNDKTVSHHQDQSGNTQDKTEG